MTEPASRLGAGRTAMGRMRRSMDQGPCALRNARLTKPFMGSQSLVCLCGGKLQVARRIVAVVHAVDALRFFRSGFCAAFSADMRCRRAAAGSSLGSWGTRRPENASFRMDWRSKSADANAAWMSACNSSTTESLPSSRQTISDCSKGEQAGSGTPARAVPVKCLIVEPVKCFSRSPAAAAKLKK